MNNQRLGYQRLAEALVERGLVEADAVQHALNAEDDGGPLFPDALIDANLVADWELSHLVCQLYGLPFLNVDMAEPDPEAQEGLDLDFLWENGIVPLTKHGQVLTLCMPAIVPAETLGYIAASTDLMVVVVVGTVVSNRRWILNNTQVSSLSGVSLEDPEGEGSWGSLFDEADAAVLQDLDGMGDLELPDDGSDLGGSDLSDGEMPEPIPVLEPTAVGNGSEDNSIGESPAQAPDSPIDLPPPLPRQADSDTDDDTIL